MDEFVSSAASGGTWGRYPIVRQLVRPLVEDRTGFLKELPSELSYLPHGQGRSYGDVCLNDGGVIFETSKFDRLIEFSPETGVLKAQAGLTLQELLRFAVPRGWFLPVSPGTQFVSLGGAVANDIHGKNHHRAGTFGRHVLALELERSDTGRAQCSPKENAELFSATIAGLGLTGFIRSVTLQLKAIPSPYFDVETIKFESLGEFFELVAESDKRFEYTVAWLDCIHGGQNFGRGHFMRGNHSAAKSPSELHDVAAPAFLKVPFDFPSLALNRFTLGAFNTVYYHRQREKVSLTRQHYRPFFYPLDAIYDWNRIYGRRGFLQFQCVVPGKGGAASPISEILRRVVASGKASFLAVIKEFGELSSPGMLSFPRPGVTLCLDFAFEGETTLRLFRELEGLVVQYGGALYPAKDACMSEQSFKQFYPRWKEFSEYIDPRSSSSFWRRVMGVG